MLFQFYTNFASFFSHEPSISHNLMLFDSDLKTKSNALPEIIKCNAVSLKNKHWHATGYF